MSESLLPKPRFTKQLILLHIVWEILGLKAELLVLGKGGNSNRQKATGSTCSRNPRLWLLFSLTHLSLPSVPRPFLQALV